MSQNIVFMASDHAGFSVKEKSKLKLKDLGFEVIDLGPGDDARVDYPDYADRVCEKVLQDTKAQGVLICGSGQGMAMRANKFSGIRAALCWDQKSTELARQHNDANVLCFGARLLEETIIFDILETFFKTSFEGGRHQSRVEKISKPIEE